MADKEDNKRSHFRLDYPKPDRPTLQYDRYQLEVIDLAEKGIKFACGGKFKPKPTQPIIGKVKFKDGKECPISGVVLRYDALRDLCVVVLTQGVPYPKMMEEQLALLRKYNKPESK